MIADEIFYNFLHPNCARDETVFVQTFVKVESIFSSISRLIKIRRKNLSYTLLLLERRRKKEKQEIW